MEKTINSTTSHPRQIAPNPISLWAMFCLQMLYLLHQAPIALPALNAANYLSLFKGTLMRKTHLTALITASCFSVFTQAASFDCGKASTATEKLICADEAISRLDEQLGASYKVALENATDKDAFKKEQVDWLKEQRNCKDRACLSSVYQSRLAKLGGNTTVAMEKSASSAYSSTASAKNPLHFTLVEGEGYPLCKDYVEMRNATEYPDTSLRSCEIKPTQYKLFRLPIWTAITDKAEMAKIVTKLETIYYLSTSHWTNENIANAINRSVKTINENKVKMYFIKEDIYKDGTQETIYKLEYLSEYESNQCNNYVRHLIDDTTFTLENAKSLPIEEAIKYDAFRHGPHAQLFYYGNTLFNSSWDGRIELKVHKANFSQLCKIETH
jgi:uncharacterized protein